MSFPVVQTTNTSTVTSSTSHAVSMPSGIVAGDKLLVFFCTDGSVTVDTPSGWTKEIDQIATAGGARRLVIYSKTAVGSDTLTVTSSGSIDSAHASYRIVTDNSYEFNAVGTASSSTTPNPPSLTPSGGSQKYMWFAVAAFASGSVSSYPTNYSSNQTESQVNSVGIAAATYNNESSSEDPAVYIISSNSAWVAATVAVEAQNGKTGTLTLIENNHSIIQPVIDFAANVSFTLLSMSSSVNPFVASASKKTNWTNEAEVSTTWTNEQQL